MAVHLFLIVPEGSIGDIDCGNVGDCQEEDKIMWNCHCNRPTHCPGEEKLGKEEPSNGGHWPRAGQEQRYHIFKRMPCCTADSEEKVKGHSFFRSSYGAPQWSICEVLQLKVFSQSRDGITMVSLDPYKESGCVDYLDPFGCCALWAICIYTLWPRESPPLHFSRPKILRSHSSGQSWASCEITIKSTTSSVGVWKHVFLVFVLFLNFIEKIELERLCLYVGILLRP